MLATSRLTPRLGQRKPYCKPNNLSLGHRILHSLPSARSLANGIQILKWFFHAFTICRGIQNKKRFPCLLLTIRVCAHFLGQQYTPTCVEWTQGFSGPARFVYTTGVGHTVGVEGLTRLWNVITFKRAKNIQIGAKTVGLRIAEKDESNANG